MKRIYKIGLLFALILAFLPVVPSFAYSGGLLHGKTMNVGRDIDHVRTTVNYATDGDENTVGNLIKDGSDFDTLWFKFDSPVTISDYRLKADYNTALSIKLYDINKNLISEMNNLGVSGIQIPFGKYANVTYVALVNTGTMDRRIFDFDVFYTADTLPPSEINGIQQSVTDIEVNLQWNNPTDFDFAGTKVYRDGQLLSTLGKTLNSFKDTNVQPSNSYTYKITTFDNDLNESNGVTVDVNTLSPDWDHVSDVSNINTTVYDDRVKITWNNPPEQSFVEVRIFKEGVLHAVATTPATSFIDYDLLPNTTYSFLLRSRSTTGYMSPGVKVTATTTGSPTTPQSFYGNPGNGQVTLYWNGTESKKDYNFIGYHIYQDGVRITNIPIKDETYMVSGLENDKLYKFEVTAIDDLNNESAKTISISLTPKEYIPISAPNGLSVVAGNGTLTLSFNRVIHEDLQGYYVYLDGVKHSGLITKNKYIISGLNNDQSYSLAVSSLSYLGEESELSEAISATPFMSDVPEVSYNYNLKDISDGIGSTFNNLWLIIAFSVSIPLSIYFSIRLKELFFG